MSLSIPASPSGIPPWMLLQGSLEILEGDERFCRTQIRGKGLQGIVIGGWDEQGRLVFYLNEGGAWRHIEDEGSAQYPKMYRTFKGILAKVRALQWAIQQGSEQKWKIGLPRKVSQVGLVFWRHPECYDAPLAEYCRLVEGNKFPGSPSQ